jgi:hypothetical protein
MTGPSGRAVEYERTDAAPRLIASLAAGAVAFLVLSPFILQLLFPQSLLRDTTVKNLVDVPAPQLQTDPQRDLARFRKMEENQLSSYGWIDRDRQIAHVPIEQALALIRERGLAGWPKP